MKFAIALAVCTVSISGFAAAQTPVDHPQLQEDTGSSPSLITCSYNSAKHYTGSESAQPGVTAGAPVKTDSGWDYTIEAPDGRSCPPTLPN